MIEGNCVSKTVFSIVFGRGHEKYTLPQKTSKKKNDEKPRTLPDSFDIFRV